MIWDEDITNRVLRMSQSGLSAREISERTGITRNAIIGKLNRLKAGVKSGNRAMWTDDRLNQLRELCAQGLTINEMADRMGLHYRQVRDCIKYRNMAWVKTRKSPSPSSVEVFLPYQQWKIWKQEQRRMGNVEV